MGRGPSEPPYQGRRHGDPQDETAHSYGEAPRMEQDPPMRRHQAVRVGTVLRVAKSRRPQNIQARPPRRRTGMINGGILHGTLGSGIPPKTEGASGTAPSSKAGKSWATWDASEAASAQAERFLPDFVIAWMLLQRSGLDASEKSVIVATLKNNVSISKVKEALKLTWPDEELRKRDSGKNAAMFTIEEEALLADEEGFEAPATPEWEDPEEKLRLSGLGG